MPLTQERHLWACANSLITQHGDAAWLFASMRADALLEQGDFEGCKTFKIILGYIETLQSTDTPPIVH